MSLGCPSCESVDQVVSIKSILGTASYSDSYSSGVVFRGAQVTPMAGRTTYIDEGLLNLQTAALNYINWPRDKHADRKKYGTAGTIMRLLPYTLSSAVIGICGSLLVPSLSSIFNPFGVTGIFGSIGVLLYAKFFALKRASKKASSLMTKEDRNEQQIRINAWFCRRCSKFFV